VSVEAHANTDGSQNLEYDYWHPPAAEADVPVGLTLRFRGPPKPMASPAAP
jgi:hypothetical protein